MFANHLKSIVSATAIMGFTIFSSSAFGHVSISNASSTSEGDRMELEFRVPHGCGHNDTRAIVITVPPEVMSNGIRTMAKGPWSSRDVDYGSNTITFKGGLLKADEYTKEYIRGRWPVTGVVTTYEFPIRQICNGGKYIDWNNPAPSVTVSP